MIPPFELSGALPPFVGNSAATPSANSPYSTTIVEVVDRFATSPTRIEILKGFLKYRSELSTLGFSTGHQMLDGSFFEDIEAIERRSPNDIDLVTFFHRPASSRGLAEWDQFQIDNLAALQRLFDPAQSKALFRCDAYGVDLDDDPSRIVVLTRYWFGLFSHRRVTRLWKGLVEIPFPSPVDDAVAHQIIDSRAGT